MVEGRSFQLRILHDGASAIRIHPESHGHRETGRRRPNAPDDPGVFYLQ